MQPPAFFKSSNSIDQEMISEVFYHSTVEKRGHAQEVAITTATHAQLGEKPVDARLWTKAEVGWKEYNVHLF